MSSFDPIFRLLRTIARPFMGKGYGELPLIRSVVAAFRRNYRPEWVDVDGVRVYLNPNDREVSAYLATHGYFEKIETELIREYLRPGMTFLDVGANIGYFTLLAASIVGKDGKVIAVEPDRTNLTFLERGIADLATQNVTLIKGAAWSSNGTLDLYLSTENPGDHQSFPSDDQREHYTVPALRLDEHEAVRKGFDVLKIDIQGAEGHALEGLRTVLERHPPETIIFEFWPHGLQKAGSAPEEVFNRLVGLGYQIERISNEDGRRYPITSYREIDSFCDLDWKFMNLFCRRKDLVG